MYMMPLLASLLPCLFIPHVFAAAEVFWNEKNYPDPTKDGFEQCGMPSKSLVCDVDRMLSERQRADLNSQLIEFENATFHPEGETPCKRKGTALAIAIVDKISEEMQKQEKLSYFAVFLHAKWTLDDECKKSFIILLPTKNWRFISRDFHYEAPQELFKNASYYEALSNIVQGLKNAIVAKTKELGEEEKDAGIVQSQPDQQPFSLLDWEHRQNQSWQRMEQMLDEFADRYQQHQVQRDEDGQQLITHISNFLNNTLAEQNSSLVESISQTINDNEHQEHQCPTTSLSTTEYLILVALMCLCYVVLSIIWHVLDFLWMLFKTKKSYNVGIKEQKSGKSFHTEECALSTTKLTTAAV